MALVCLHEPVTGSRRVLPGLGVHASVGAAEILCVGLCAWGSARGALCPGDTHNMQMHTIVSPNHRSQRRLGACPVQPPSGTEASGALLPLNVPFSGALGTCKNMDKRKPWVMDGSRRRGWGVYKCVQGWGWGWRGGWGWGGGGAPSPADSQDNNLENNEIKALVQVLLTCSDDSLTKLDLSNNPISLAGGSALIELLTSRKSLTEVRLEGTLVQPKILDKIQDIAGNNRAMHQGQRS